MYSPIEEYINVTKNKSKLWPYLTDLLKYPFANWGKKINEGTKTEERIDAGHWLLKRFKLGVRFWAVTIPLVLLFRATLNPEYSFSANFLGALYFVGAGFLYFWMASNMGHAI